MASYLTQPAYQTYQTDSYKLPVQQIVQAIDTRNKYWDMGASQIKSAYQNYLNLDLSLKSNKDKLDNLMQGVNTNLKKIVSTDLSLADNVSTGMKIFDPITKDDGIKYDNAVTKHYKQQMNIAQNLKNTDGGKYYNDVNVADMMSGYKKWIESDDPEKGREVYNNRKYYTPYHDVMAEWNILEKNFKPDTKLFLRPETDEKGNPTNNGRMIEEKNKSIYASQFRAYMSAHLSDKAKEQLRTNGRVAYGDHIDILAADATDYNIGKIDTYNKEIEELKGRKKSALESGRLAEAEAYQHDIDRYDTEVKKLTIENTKLKIKDYSDLIKNQDNVAGQIYSSNWIDNISKSSERKDIEIKYSKDDVALFFLKMSNDNENKTLDRELDWEIAKLNNETRLATAGKKKDENGNPIIETEPVYDVSTEGDNENFGKPQVDDMISNGEKIKINAAESLNKYLTSIGIIDPKKSKTTNDAAMEEWKKNNPDDWRWKEYREQLDLGDSNIAAGKAIHDYVNSEMNKRHPKLIEELNLKLDKKDYNIIVETSPGKGVNITTPFSLSEKDMFNILNGESVKGITKKDLKNSSNQIIGTELYYNNQKISTSFGKNDSLYDLLTNIYQKQSSYRGEAQKIYNQAITKVQGLERFSESAKDNDAIKSVQTVIYNKLSATGVKPDDVTITYRDKSGGIYFKVNATAENVSPSKIKEIITSSGGKYKSQFEGGSYYLPNSEVGSFIKPKSFSDPRLDNIQTQVDWRTAASKNNDIFNSTTIKFNNRDFKFRITVKNGLPLYEVIDEDSGASFIDFSTQQPFSSLEQAAAMASVLSRLKPEDLETKIRNKKIGNKPDYKIK